ncbi:hypothetical protein KP509_1Z278700 [Ceratopteris richardii]|nr:hypothetical protein KP509_1Z278700 [Ceratopteris richardii]
MGDGPSRDGARGSSNGSNRFEKEAHKAKFQALLVAALHKLSGVLGIMALTWATVVLLGGFVSDLSTWDFYLISALLLAESFRLFIIQIFIKIVSRILYREKRNPKEFEFTDKQSEVVSRLNFLGQVLSGSVAFLCFFFTIYRVAIRGSPPFSSEEGPKHMAPALYIFYTIVFLNCVIAILSSALHLLFRSFQNTNDKSNGNKEVNSLATFFDKIYRTAIEKGTTDAGEIDLLDFAFDKIASDLKRDIRPLVVRNVNKQMIQYMSGELGVLMTCQYLKGDDLWKRIAAANLPGFWKDNKEIPKNKELLFSLRDRVSGLGPDANASLNSIESLARFWSESLQQSKSPNHPFVINSTVDNGGNVLDTIVNLLLTTRSSLVFKVRAFEACCRDFRVRQYLYEQSSQHSEQQMDKAKMNVRLNELVVEEVTKHDGDHQEVAKNDDRCAVLSKTTLEQLCTTIVGVISPRSPNVRIPTRIYSARALMLLLRHVSESESHECKAAQAKASQALRNWVSSRLKPDHHDKDKVGYFAPADIEAAEKVRKWVDLKEDFKWTSWRVVDLDGDCKDMTSAQIAAIVDAS